MSKNTEKDPLEGARARLESALSRLAQGVAGSRDVAETASQISDEKAALAEQVARLEQENLGLHEQIAALSLKQAAAEAGAESGSGDDARLSELKAEKKALEQNYSLLKRQYANLQDDLEAAVNAKGPTAANDGGSDAQLASENAELKKAIMALQVERDNVRSQLDLNISKLETMVGEA